MPTHTLDELNNVGILWIGEVPRHTGIFLKKDNEGNLILPIGMDICETTEGNMTEEKIEYTNEWEKMLTQLIGKKVQIMTRNHVLIEDAILVAVKDGIIQANTKGHKVTHTRLMRVEDVEIVSYDNE